MAFVISTGQGLSLTLLEVKTHFKYDQTSKNISIANKPPKKVEDIGWSKYLEGMETSNIAQIKMKKIRA